MGAVDHRQEFDLLSAAAERLGARGLGDALAAVQTGSGIPLPELTDRETLHWSDLEGFPASSAPGHAGALHFGRCRDVPVLVLEGRLHLYEGHGAHEVVRPVRTLGLLGVRNFILTNASGGVREDLAAGDVVRVTDHVNLMGTDPLAGVNDPRFGERFVVTAGRSHDPKLALLAAESAKMAGVKLNDGVYGGLPGPSFETPAEVRRLRGMGIDVVGMSTVPEVLAATQMGRKVLVLSLVANPAGVVAADANAAEEVLEVGAAHGGDVTAIVEGVVERLG